MPRRPPRIFPDLRRKRGFDLQQHPTPQHSQMGSAASKPAKSAASAAVRRQYPKKAAPPPTGQRKAPQEAKAASTPKPATAAPNLEYTPSTPRTPTPSSQGPTYHSKEPASSVKSDGMSSPRNPSSIQTSTAPFAKVGPPISLAKG